MTLDKDEVLRYRRHLMLKEIGMEGQLRLKNARVLIIGAGGLGSPICLYLAAAGVGNLGLMDFDSVDVTNLQRQIIFRTNEIGKSKASSARDHLYALNPYIQAQVFEHRLTKKNALSSIAPFDIVIDGSDNFQTRYVLNDACHFQKKPLVYGSIYRFEGQAAVFDTNRGPCYRCLFPKPPPQGRAPSCAEAGVLGVLPGIIGTIQATEALKLILGIGEPLIGRLLIFDALKMRFHELSLKKNPKCSLCGDMPSVHELKTEELASNTDPASQIAELTPEEFSTWRRSGQPFFLLDVRDRYEYDVANLGGHLIPLVELHKRIDELNKGMPLVVHCESGERSLRACQLLKKVGFNKLWNLRGNIADIDAKK